MRTLRAFLVLLLIAAVPALGACSRNMTRGAAIGAATGAGLGLATGNGVLGSAAKGAAVGAVGGFVYDQLD